MPDKYKQALTSKWAYLAYGLLLGVLIIFAIRFVSYQPEETHYHANFAVYIDGKREEFKGPQYYQEVKVCSLHGATPAARTHMHDEENGVVHVHDDAVTWGQFFENLGWNLGPDFIRDRTALHVAEGDNKLNIVLNGDNLTDLSSVSNQVIGDEDRLLLSYGAVDKATLDTQFKTVPADAHEYNHKNDPASCSGAHGTSVSDRLKHLL